MLRPQDTTTRETKRLDGIWSFAARRGRGRPGRGLVAGDAARRPADAGPEQLQRRAGGPRGARPRRRRLVPALGLRPPRLGRAADRPALRRGDAPGRGLGRRHAASPSTRAATRRSRPTSAPSSARARNAGSRSSSTTSSRGSPSRPASSRCCRTGPGVSGSTTTSSTTPGLHRSVWLYTTPHVAHRRRHGGDRHRRRGRRGPVRRGGRGRR